MSNIKCTVEECQYNSSDICQASTIEINPNVKDHMISNSKDTACETFMTKGKVIE
ncbi:DUF1540 domain-containing protein [Natroniella acetigena]|uniref:DUF1540 domain-containing protein n=1 Tax=Natroniella acetigena TaxID=52004 RepID=UPI00200B3ED7|nr:DUF1540 domain-containing protein [Natroniella acetigena]MCK8827052.1 DUF1540 domain-containing protein [Natroniella acetigena]